MTRSFKHTTLLLLQLFGCSVAFVPILPQQALTGNRLSLKPLADQNQAIEEESDISRLLEKNRQWVAEKKKGDRKYFSKHKKGQTPQYLYIGCSDSRVPASELMGAGLGEVFVARNVANLVVNTDASLLSVLEYSIHVLGIQDILVVGHYGCGGVKAAMTNQDHGLVEHWIRNIRDVGRIHQNEIQSIRNEEARWNRMVELNVQEQCLNLFNNPIVQKKQAEGGLPRIHGLVYDIGEGLLKKLDIDFKTEVTKNQPIYKLYDIKGEIPSGGGEAIKKSNFGI